MKLPAPALVLALLLAASAPAFAQTDMYMPEGTRELTVGVTVVSTARAEGDARRRMLVVPSLSAVFSNGVFLSPGSAGMQLSGTPGLRYGPLLSYTLAQRADAQDNKLRLKIQAGGFASYRVLHGLGASASLLYGGGDNHKGLRANAGLNASLPLAPHHALSAGLGVSWADRAYMASYFDSAQYRAGAGMHSVRTGADWSWEINTKYSLSTGTDVTRLVGSAADSPIVREKTSVTYYSSLNYQF